MIWKTTEVRPYGITAEGTHFFTSRLLYTTISYHLITLTALVVPSV